MHIDDTVKQRRFRREVREFVRTACDPEARRKVRLGLKPSRDDIVNWQRALNSRGWAVPHWPREWGGQGWGPIELNILSEEMYLAHAPEPLSQNIKMVGPVIAHFGTEAQKRRFLPAIANLDLWFCQGFSEPNAGSDLASLRTRAVRDGGHYVVQGQKIWTSGAQNADWIFCLVRTDVEAKPQRGISFLLIDIKSPGVTVRPIEGIDGLSELNEVFFDEVRVPVDQLIGEENRGWDYAKFLLVNERTNVARVGLSRQRLHRALSIAGCEDDVRALSKRRPELAQRIAITEAHLKALEMTQLRMLSTLSSSSASESEVAVVSSILKIRGSELQQQTAELMLEAAGPDGLFDLRGEVMGASSPWQGVAPGDCPEHVDGAAGIGIMSECTPPAWAAGVPATYLFARAASIYGGSNEIQRNIVAKALIG